MIKNYYNIPNIKCGERLGIDGKTTEEIEKLTLVDKQLRCSGLNSDNIYSTLFPDRADPTINYDVNSSKKINVGSLIGRVSEKDAKQCSQDCSSDVGCTYFTIEKGPNQCRLYGTKEVTKNDKFVELEKKNNIFTWRKNDLLDGTKNCNIEDSFISQNIGYFPKVDSADDNIKPTNTQQGLSKNECLSSCLYDDNCNSVVFLESKSACSKMGSITYDSARNALSAPSSANPNASTYLKKDKSSLLTNRFGISDNMMDYYKTYSSSGKVGDSFCEYIQEKNECMTSYVVGPNNQKEMPSINPKSVTKVPAPKLCMPPNCIPKLPETGLKGKLKVDASFNIMCPTGDGPDAKECVKAIDKTPFVTFDRMGLPTDNDGSNPPNGYLPYTLEYDTYNNLEISASSLTDSGDACVAKPMNNSEKPLIGSMEFPEDCQNWCSKSVDCGGYSYYFGSDGKAKCNYYDNVGMMSLKDSLKPKKDTHTLIKRGNRYVQKPPQGEIKKPYFNNSSAADTGVVRERVCIQEGFTDKNDPLINYDVYESKASNVGNQIGDITKKNEKQCAQDCSNNKDCTNFLSGKLKNACWTFKEKNMVKDDNFRGSMYYNINAWSRNDLSDDKFIFKENYFPENSANSNLNIYETNSIDECYSHCLADNNCNSIVYVEGRSDQSLCKMVNSKRSDFISNLENSNDRDYKISSYLKKEEMTGSQSGINHDKYCPFPYNKTPASDTNKIEKDDDNGSNCPTPLVKCGDTRYGCCPDNETSKVNISGSNCPVLSRVDCLESAFGCCPGTIIPMEYLCDKEGDDLCKMTNCELNDNERGGPYAFYGGKGVKCSNNSSCSPGQMCVDGTCKFYNEKYYNVLNGVKMEAMHRESGNSMNDLLCGCENQPRSTTCDNTIYDPICGVDGKTYRSRCVAENLGIKVEHYGTCADILEKFYSLDDFKIPVKNTRTSYWILSLLLILLVGSILYCFR